MKSLSIRSGHPARSATGTVVVGLEARCDTPSRLHEPAHRPSGLVATPPAFQDFATPSIAGGCVRSSREEDTSQKLASSSTTLCGFPTYPRCARRVAALKATPPGQRRITQIPERFPSSAEGCTHIVLLTGTPAAKKRPPLYLRNRPPARASRSPALIFLHSTRWAAAISSPSMPE